MSTKQVQRPRILAIDLPRKDVQNLQDLGHKVTRGSLGDVYSFTPQNAVLPVAVRYNLPDFLEHDIVLIDLQNPVQHTELPPQRGTRLDEEGPWANLDTGRVDTRPFVLHTHRHALMKLLGVGAVVVVFLVGETRSRLFLTTRRMAQVKQDPEFCNWWIHSLLETRFPPREGSEIRPSGSDPLNRYVLEGRFSAIVTGKNSPGSSMNVLALNRFDEPVSIKWTPNGSDGAVIILPEVADRMSLLNYLMREYLPERHPTLFPDYEGKTWILRDEYLPQGVKELKREIEEIQASANEKISGIQDKIRSLHIQNQHHSDLLTESGETLVDAVFRVMQDLGILNIVKADDEVVDTGQKNRREDLRFELDGSTILVEVKGISGTPKESASLQVFKYLAPRMKALRRVNVRGLAIINHQRHVPALDRAADPFQDDVVTTAESHDIGLMTTRDLFRLAKAAARYRWHSEMVAPLFAGSGRISAIPPSFSLVGRVTDVWERNGAIGIRLVGKLSAVSVLLFDFSEELIQARIRSLQVENTARQEAESGELAGIVLDADLDIARFRRAPMAYAQALQIFPRWD